MKLFMLFRDEILKIFSIALQTVAIDEKSQKYIFFVLYFIEFGSDNIILLLFSICYFVFCNIVKIENYIVLNDNDLPNFSFFFTCVSLLLQMRRTLKYIHLILNGLYN